MVSNNMDPNIIQQNVLQLQNKGASPQDIEDYVRLSTQESGTGSPNPENPNPNQGFSFVKTLENIPSSFGSTVGGIFNAITNPIETVKNLGKVVVGGAEKLIPGQQPQEQNFNQVVDFFKGRYGSVENLKQTIQNDPVGFALDVSSVLSAGGGALSKVGALSKAGNIISKVGEITEPLGVTARIASKLTSLAGKATGGVSGLLTGTGNAELDAFRAARAGGEAGKAFTQAMRGITTESDALDQARLAVSDIAEQRKNTYVPQLEKIKTNTQELSFDTIAKEKDALIKNFGIQETVEEVKNPDGSIDQTRKLDFSRSPIGSNPEAVNDIKFIDNMVNDWGSQPGDFTAAGLDTLKRRLGEFYSENGRARAFSTALYDKVRQTLIDNVPGYEKMVSEYEKTSNDLKNIQQSLSLKSTSGNDTAIKKLISTVRENQEYRKAVLDQLQTGVKNKFIKEQIAGIALRQGIPRGLVAKLLAGGTPTGVALFGVSPYALLTLGASSPRLAGEFVNALGATAKQVDRVVNFMDTYHLTDPEVRQAIFQATRATNSSFPSP